MEGVTDEEENRGLVIWSPRKSQLRCYEEVKQMDTLAATFLSRSQVQCLKSILCCCNRITQIK